MALFEGYSFSSDEVDARYQVLDDVNVFALAGTQGLKASKNDFIAFDKYSDSWQVAYSYLDQYDNNITCLLPSYIDDSYLVLRNFDRFNEHYLWHGGYGSLYAVQDDNGNTLIGSRSMCSDGTYSLADIQYVFCSICIGTSDYHGQGNGVF